MQYRADNTRDGSNERDALSGGAGFIRAAQLQHALITREHESMRGANGGQQRR